MEIIPTFGHFVTTGHLVLTTHPVDHHTTIAGSLLLMKLYFKLTLGLNELVKKMGVVCPYGREMRSARDCGSSIDCSRSGHSANQIHVKY